jgi:hypothetical protein
LRSTAMLLKPFDSLTISSAIYYLPKVLTSESNKSALNCDDPNLTWNL